MSKAHPGFKAVQNRIAAKEGISKDRAGAILASAARHASKAAKKKNPRLLRVSGNGGSTHHSRQIAPKAKRMGGY